MLKFVLKILPFSFMRKTINQQPKTNKKEEKQKARKIYKPFQKNCQNSSVFRNQSGKRKW